ncbi:MAG TPA: alpha/beta hydrolase-fold protein [Bryobacteraceae bacterium]|nr:alpha/beta hydrolase-fold protein [Bryobacteraceae bacterium]
MKVIASLATVILMTAAVRADTQLIESDFASTLVIKPAPYAVLLPDNFSKTGKPLPMLLYLHGGGGDRSQLRRSRAMIEELWQAGKLARMVIVAPSATPRAFYMDQKNGPEKWETLLTGPFREHIQKNYNTSRDPKENLLMGASMGGMGSLRLGFKHPELYGGLAALERASSPSCTGRT